MLEQKNISIEEKIGQLIITGFHGKTVQDTGVKIALEQVRNGEIGGVGIFRHNITGKNQLSDLLDQFNQVDSKFPPLISLDQEGGKVQRINEASGHADTCSAKEVATSMSIDEAFEHYCKLGDMLSTTGFNFNCAPCVDLDGDPGCKVIGGIERSYSDDADTVVSYAGAMIDGLHEHGVLNCIKHFPGHGRVSGDTHEGLVDMTETWSEEELKPFRLLIEGGKVDAVMTAHLLNKNVDPEFPGTLSKVWLSKLRKDCGFKGVIVSDCMHMGAMLKNYNLEQVIVNGINAGLDIFYYSNNPLAAQDAGIRHSSDSEDEYITVGDWRVPDPDLPRKIREVILAAISDGRISEEAINSSFSRVVSLKSKLTEYGQSKD